MGRIQQYSADLLGLSWLHETLRTHIQQQYRAPTWTRGSCVRAAWTSCSSTAIVTKDPGLLRGTGQTLLERYGMTETGMIISNPYRGERRAGFVGLPLPGVTIKLVSVPPPKDSNGDGDGSTTLEGTARSCK